MRTHYGHWACGCGHETVFVCLALDSPVHKPGTLASLFPAQAGVIRWPIYPKLGRHSDNPWQGSAADKHQKASRAMITWVAIHGLERFSVFVLSAKLLVRLLVVAFLVCRYQLSWCAPAFLVDGQLSWCSVLRAVALPQLVRVVASSLELS